MAALARPAVRWPFVRKLQTAEGGYPIFQIRLTLRTVSGILCPSDLQETE